MSSAPARRRFGLLVSERYVERFGSSLQEKQRQLLEQANVSLELVVLPMQQEGSAELDLSNAAGRKCGTNTLPQASLANIDMAFASEDLQFNWATMLSFVAACAEAPCLRWLQTSWIGVDWPFLKPVKDRHITITNAAGSNAIPIATSVLAGILALNRGLPQWMLAKSDHTWMHRDALPARRDLQGQSVLVYGMGAIGHEVARMCRALQMIVVGMQRRVTREGSGIFHRVVLSNRENLATEVALADFIVVCCPLTESTRGVFDQDILSRMKRTACFINVARGPIADELALASLLKDGRIEGAYLDAFSTEPLPKEL